MHIGMSVTHTRRAEPRLALALVHDYGNPKEIFLVDYVGPNTWYRDVLPHLQTLTRKRLPSHGWSFEHRIMPGNHKVLSLYHRRGYFHGYPPDSWEVELRRRRHLSKSHMDPPGGKAVENPTHYRVLVHDGTTSRYTQQGTNVRTVWADAPATVGVHDTLTWSSGPALLAAMPLNGTTVAVDAFGNLAAWLSHVDVCRNAAPMCAAIRLVVR